MFSLSEQSNSQFSVLAFQFYFPKRVKKVSDPMYDGGYLSFTSLCKKPIIVRNTLQQLKEIQVEFVPASFSVISKCQCHWLTLSCRFAFFYL